MTKNKLIIVLFLSCACSVQAVSSGSESEGGTPRRHSGYGTSSSSNGPAHAVGASSSGLTGGASSSNAAPSNLANEPAASAWDMFLTGIDTTGAPAWAEMSPPPPVGSPLTTTSASAWTAPATPAPAFDWTTVVLPPVPAFPFPAPAAAGNPLTTTPTLELWPQASAGAQAWNAYTNPNTLAIITPATTPTPTQSQQRHLDNLTNALSQLTTMRGGLQGLVLMMDSAASSSTSPWTTSTPSRTADGAAASAASRFASPTPTKRNLDTPPGAPKPDYSELRILQYTKDILKIQAAILILQDQLTKNIDLRNMSIGAENIANNILVSPLEGRASLAKRISSSISFDRPTGTQETIAVVGGISSNLARSPLPSVADVVAGVPLTAIPVPQGGPENISQSIQLIQGLLTQNNNLLAAKRIQLEEAQRNLPNRR